MQKIPFLSSKELQSEMQKLRDKDMRELALKSGLSYDALARVRRGIIANPGIETCRKFWPHLQEMISNKKAE